MSRGPFWPAAFLWLELTKEPLLLDLVAHGAVEDVVESDRAFLDAFAAAIAGPADEVADKSRSVAICERFEQSRFKVAAAQNEPKIVEKRRRIEREQVVLQFG